MKILLISANWATTPYPIYPIGMSMVATALKQNGHEVEMFDFLQYGCSFDAVRTKVEAVQPELQDAAHKASRTSLQAGIVAFLASLVPFLILILPLIIGGADASLSFLEKIDQSLTPLRLALSALLGVLPGLLFGYWAVTQSQQAAWYQNLDALFDQPGRLRSRVGRILGWIAIYICAAWILVILVALLLG